MDHERISPGALKSEEEHRREMCVAGRWMQERGYVPATDGNLSVRLDEARILTTPTCLSKGALSPEDLVVTDLSGRRISGGRDPSSEMGMHVLIYQRRPEVRAICHAHPPVATGYAAAGISLNRALLGEVVVTLGYIPVAPYGTPGTPELAEALEPFVQHFDAMLLANHGVVTCGPDLLTAFCRLETTEHCARVSLVTELLGRQNLLSNCDVEKLLAARKRYGIQTIAPDNPAELVTAETYPEHAVQMRQHLTELIEEVLQREMTKYGTARERNVSAERTDRGGLAVPLSSLWSRLLIAIRPRWTASFRRSGLP